MRLELWLKRKELLPQIKLLLVLLFLLCFGSFSCTTNAPSIYSEFLSFPSKPIEAFDLRESFLLLIPEEEASFNVFVDEAIEKLKPSINQAPLMEERIKILNDYFFKELEFTFDSHDPLGQNPDNVHLGQVISRRRGFCLSLSLLYMLIGLELDLPLHGVKAPNHFFLRCEEVGGGFFNIESTNAGLPFPNSYYVEEFKITSKALLNEYYLRNLTVKEVFAEYLSNYLVWWKPPEGTKVLALNQLAATLSPNSPEVHFNYANTLYKEGQLEEALKIYSRAIALNSTNADAFSQRAVVYGKLGFFKKALKDFERALFLKPNHLPSLWNRALAFHRNEQLGFAREDYLKLLELNPKHAGGHYNLALLFLKEKKLKLAQKHAGEAVYLEPENTKYRESLKNIEQKIKH